MPEMFLSCLQDGEKICLLVIAVRELRYHTVLRAADLAEVYFALPVE